MTKAKLRKDYQSHKKEWEAMLKTEEERKIDKCRITDQFGKGKHGFDYFKMAEMYHKGEW